MLDAYSTIQAINYLRDSGWIPVQAGQASANKEQRKGFQKHMIRFTRPDLVIDDNRMDLLLYNSHDRGCAFKLIGGVFRFVCANGMVVGDKMAEYSHRHVGFSPEKFISSAKAVGNHIEKIAHVVDDWKSIKLEKNEQGVFASAVHDFLYEESAKSPIMPERLLTVRRFKDRESSDLWTTFNTVQENVIRGGLPGRNAKGRRVRTRAVRSLDKDRKLNQALWTLTEKMAALKTA
ncbi:MAG: DUF945 domain-containing protein [Desulfobacteraceae bacterium]|nr:DUF945 domain-containing protein [Desulfobacteraceae bacterium]